MKYAKKYMKYAFAWKFSFPGKWERNFPFLFLSWHTPGKKYTLYNNGDNCPPCLIPFAQRNVIDNELPHRTINSCSLYQTINNFTICNGTFLSNSFTLHLLLGGDGLGHLYIHYTTMGITVPLAWSLLHNGISLIMSYPSVL